MAGGVCECPRPSVLDGDYNAGRVREGSPVNTRYNMGNSRAKKDAAPDLAEETISDAPSAESPATGPEQESTTDAATDAGETTATDTETIHSETEDDERGKDSTEVVNGATSADPSISGEPIASIGDSERVETERGPAGATEEAASPSEDSAIADGTNAFHQFEESSAPTVADDPTPEDEAPSEDKIPAEDTVRPMQLPTEDTSFDGLPIFSDIIGDGEPLLPHHRFDDPLGMTSMIVQDGKISDEVYLGISFKMEDEPGKGAVGETFIGVNLGPEDRARLRKALDTHERFGTVSCGILGEVEELAKTRTLFFLRTGNPEKWAELESEAQKADAIESLPDDLQDVMLRARADAESGAFLAQA